MSGLPADPASVRLSDGVVTVRHRRQDDLPAIAAAVDDPEAQRWLDQGPQPALVRTPEQIVEIWRSGSATPLLIVDATTDEPAGLINLQFRADAEPSVAYRIFPAWRGRGYASRALELVTVWALGDVGLPRLVLEIEEANVASMRVAARCGYVRDGSVTSGEPVRVVLVRSA